MRSCSFRTGARLSDALVQPCERQALLELDWPQLPAVQDAAQAEKAAEPQLHELIMRAAMEIESGKLDDLLFSHAAENGPAASGSLSGTSCSSRLPLSGELWSSCSDAELLSGSTHSTMPNALDAHVMDLCPLGPIAGLPSEQDLFAHQLPAYTTPTGLGLLKLQLDPSAAAAAAPPMPMQPIIPASMLPRQAPPALGATGNIAAINNVNAAGSMHHPDGPDGPVHSLGLGLNLSCSANAMSVVFACGKWTPVSAASGGSEDSGRPSDTSMGTAATATTAAATAAGNFVSKKELKRRPISPKPTVTAQQLGQLMHMPVKEARAHLGISKESFRALVQGHGLKRWPQRQLSALDNLLDWVREDAKMAGTGQLEEVEERIAQNVIAIQNGEAHEVFQDLQQLSHVYHNRKHQQVAMRRKSSV